MDRNENAETIKEVSKIDAMRFRDGGFENKKVQMGEGAVNMVVLWNIPLHRVKICHCGWSDKELKGQ